MSDTDRIQQMISGIYDDAAEREGLAKSFDTGAEASAHKLGGVLTKDGKPASLDEEKRTIDFRITDKTLDSYGDVVIPNGMNNERFRKNPVILLNHNFWGLPVANSLHEKASANEVISKAVFPSAEIPGFAMPDTLFHLYATGFMHATSITLKPNKWEKRYSKDKDGAKVWTGGYTFHEWALIEYSLVTIPANENALKKMSSIVLDEARQLGMIGSVPTLPALDEAAKALAANPDLIDSGVLDAAIERVLRRSKLFAELEAQQEALAIAKADKLRERQENLGKALTAIQGIGAYFSR